MRKVEFTIPGFPDVQITITELVDGSLNFDVATVGPAAGDLRGLFFDFGLPTDTLVVAGADVTDQDFDAVRDLGNGANMKGAVDKDGYDVGVEFGTQGIGKDDISSTSFNLSSSDETVVLTLDMIAYMEFGARVTSTGVDGDRSGSQKITAIAPAAPDAIDDVDTTLEDIPVTIDVLANDTDADGDPLTILEVDDPVNGSAIIVDNKIVYVGDEHWSGTETFSYLMTDGNGGCDVAEVTVTVVAVADPPNLALSAVAGATVQEVVVRIDSSLVDTDGSESYSLSIGALPAGVILSGAPGGVIANPTGEDYVTLTLPEGMDFDFDLAVTATSVEASNGDMASTVESLDIVFDYDEIAGSVVFEADGLNMWGPGPEFVFDDERFIGIDESGGTSGSAVVDYSFSYDVRMGLDSDLQIRGGDFEADVPFDLDFATAYNRTTDALSIDTAALLGAGGGFLTDGPSMTYVLDFILEAALSAQVGIDIAGIIDETFFNISPSINWTPNLVDYNSETSGGISIPLPFGFSGDIEWPNLDVSDSSLVGGTYTGSGASNNFVQLNNDVDQLVADVFFGGANPFDVGVDIGIASASLELLDLDLNAGLNFLQEFALDTGILDATMVFEDGTTQAFTFGDELIFAGASALDDDGDGTIDFGIDMDLLGTTFSNDTDLGFNVGYNFDVFKLNWAYDVLVASDSGTVGPLVNLGGSLPVADVDIYDDTFDVAFASEEFVFAV